MNRFLGFFSLCITLLSSCQDYDLTTEEVLVKTSFERNFKKTFGEIDPHQSWDLTKTLPRTAKYDIHAMSPSATRATHAGEEYTAATEGETAQLITQPADISDPYNTAWNGWYQVQAPTLQWMDNILVEQQNNTLLGSPFTLVAPDNYFAIIPIYQGRAGMTWDLHLVDLTTNKDYNLWSQSDGIWMQEEVTDEGGSTSLQWRQPGNEYENSYTINAKQIVSRPIIINPNIIQGEFFLYLDITRGMTEGSIPDYENIDFAKTGTAQRSDEGMMLSLNCPIPTNLDAFTSQENSLVMIVGCEDANLKNSDWDMNDVVFLIVGYPNVPDIIEHYYKRYLCEDLGNTYDFDFNDIVVDANQTSYFRAQLTADKNSVVRVEDVSQRTQSATIAHVCGELPFQVTIGNYSFPAVTKPTNKEQTKSELAAAGTTRATGWEPNVTKTITGWDKDENNINIRVAKNPKDAIILTGAFGADEVIEENADEHIYRINFPQDGTAPLIIAVDRTIDWMAEYQHIPEEWWKEGKFYEEEVDPDDPEPVWDYTQVELTYEANGDAILTTVLHAITNYYGQLDDLYQQSDGHARLLKALDDGFTTLNIYFEEETSGSYTVHNGKNEGISERTQFSSTMVLNVPLNATEISSIYANNGLRLELWVDWKEGDRPGQANVVKVTMSK